MNWAGAGKSMGQAALKIKGSDVAFTLDAVARAPRWVCGAGVHSYAEWPAWG